MELSPFLWTILWNIVIAIWIIGVVFLSRIFKNKLLKYLEYITATTVWLLLWIIFLWFLPKLTTKWSLVWVELGVFILIWVFIFYLLELFLHWHHCKDLGHEDSCHSHHTSEHKNGIMMFGWTILHNGFHWIVLFSAFAVDFHFWVATTIAILLHSIPQNIVNYVMNHNNIKFAYLAAFGGILWALITYPFAEFLTENKFYILAIIAWGLLYTALADIFPEFKGKGTTKKKFVYLVFIVIWILSFVWFEKISSHGHNHRKHEMNNVIHEDKHNYEKLEYECRKVWWKWVEWLNECKL